MAHADEKRTIVNLVADVLDDATHLFQTEIRLIRAEINEKISQVANVGALLAAGVIAGLAAIFLLLQAVVRWLEVAGVPDRWGYLLVGLAVTAIAAALIAKGLNNLKATNLVPDRTLDQIRTDFATVKEHVR